MLYRSLIKVLNLDGKSITQNVNERFLKIKKAVLTKKTLRLAIYIFLNQRVIKKK